MTSYQCNYTLDWDSYLAVLGMVNWLAHDILQVPVCHEDLPHLISSLSVSSWTQPSPMNTKFSYPSVSLHAMIKSWHQVQHTPSTAYTDYSIHWVQHTSSTAYTEYCIDCILHHPKIYYLLLRASLSADLAVLNSLHSHNCELTNQ